MAPNVVQTATPRSIPITPTEERWQAMTQAEREQFMTEANDALSDPLIVMAEGRPHKKAKSRAIDMLGLHFRAMGWHFYLADELSVLYPEHEAFSPDIMVVRDVEEPEDDQRMSWVVMDEGKGLYWVLEVLWSGDRKKDLVENVERYAALGIPEYFVYDQRKQHLLGYRLPPGAKRYQPILPQAGLYRSNVLGLDLAIVKNSLRFFQGTAELYETTHLIERLEGMIENLEERAEQAVREVEEARIGMRRAIVAFLATRGVTCSADGLAQLDACTESKQLERWLHRALLVASEADMFAEE